ncbi:hypothetical protein E3P96_02958 [Wallemia ichthyophaga]|nr:hypothetical protein E3P96_02958 [Wallemia ichthyophaga]
MTHNLSAHMHDTGGGFYTSVDLPMFRLGFRYYACEAYPEKPSAFRTIPYAATNVAFSMQDRSPHVEFSRDRRSVRANTGYRSIRTPEPMRQGTYYYEVRVDRGGEEVVVDSGSGRDRDDGGNGSRSAATPTNASAEPPNAHVRIGVSRRQAESGAPVGYDGYSYGWRDANGHKVHLSRSQRCAEGFKTGDVVGVLVHLPQKGDSHANTSISINRSRIPIKYKDNLWFELPEYAQSKEMELLMEFGSEEEIQLPVDQGGGSNSKMGKRPPKGIKIPRIPGSFIEFYKNGKKAHTHPAFTDLLDYTPTPTPAPREQAKKRGKDAPAPQLKHDMDYDDGTCGYYPMVSLFGGGQATLNPGPNFVCPPDTAHRYTPLAARFEEFWYDEMRTLDNAACANAPVYSHLDQYQPQPQPQIQPQASPHTLPQPKSVDDPPANPLPGATDATQSLNQQVHSEVDASQIETQLQLQLQTQTKEHVAQNHLQPNSQPNSNIHEQRTLNALPPPPQPPTQIFHPTFHIPYPIEIPDAPDVQMHDEHMESDSDYETNGSAGRRQRRVTIYHATTRRGQKRERRNSKRASNSTTRRRKVKMYSARAESSSYKDSKDGKDYKEKENYLPTPEPSSDAGVYGEGSAYVPAPVHKPALKPMLKRGIPCMGTAVGGLNGLDGLAQVAGLATPPPSSPVSVHADIQKQEQEHTYSDFTSIDSDSASAEKQRDDNDELLTRATPTKPTQPPQPETHIHASPTRTTVIGRGRQDWQKAQGWHAHLQQTDGRARHYVFPSTHGHVSRVHLCVSPDAPHNSYTVHVLGRNGVTVNGRHIARGARLRMAHRRGGVTVSCLVPHRLAARPRYKLVARSQTPAVDVALGHTRFAFHWNDLIQPKSVLSDCVSDESESEECDADGARAGPATPTKRKRGGKQEKNVVNSVDGADGVDKLNTATHTEHRNTHSHTHTHTLQHLGLVAQTLALNVPTSLTPVTDIVGCLLANNPSLKDGRAHWEEMVERTLLDAPGEMFGCVERSGRDAANRPLPNLYYYQPANDPDRVRAQSLAPLTRVPRLASRASQAKSIFWKPVSVRPKKKW